MQSVSLGKKWNLPPCGNWLSQLSVVGEFDDDLLFEDSDNYISPAVCVKDSSKEPAMQR
jgi:hypothetical protein